MNKIKITTIPRCVTMGKGFSARGCLGTPCGDRCCRFGCDVDKESYDLIFANRAPIEGIIKRRIEDCFTVWSGDPEFLGNDSIRSRTGEDGFCMFHNPSARGCALYTLVLEKRLPRRLIPSICRLFPLTWNKGVLQYSSELGQDVIPLSCDCVTQAEDGLKSAMQTQAEEFFDIFITEEPLAM